MPILSFRINIDFWVNIIYFSECIYLVLSLFFAFQALKSHFLEKNFLYKTSCFLNYKEYTLKADICVIQLGTVNFQIQNSLNFQNSQIGCLLASRAFHILLENWCGFESTFNSNTTVSGNKRTQKTALQLV